MRARRFQHQSVNKKAPTKTYFLTNKKENDFPYDFVTSPKRRWIEVQCCHYGYENQRNLPQNIIMHCSFIKRDPYVDHMVFFCNPPHGKRTKHKKYEYTSPDDHFTIWFTNPIPQRRAIQRLPPRGGGGAGGGPGGGGPGGDDWIYEQFQIEDFTDIPPFDVFGDIPIILADEYFTIMNENGWYDDMTAVDKTLLDQLAEELRALVSPEIFDQELLDFLDKMFQLMVPGSVEHYIFLMFATLLQETIDRLNAGDVDYDWTNLYKFFSPVLIDNDDDFTENNILGLYAEIITDNDKMPEDFKPTAFREMAYYYMLVFPANNEDGGRFFDSYFDDNAGSYQNILPSIVTELFKPADPTWDSPSWNRQRFQAYFPTYYYLLQQCNGDVIKTKQVYELFNKFFTLDTNSNEQRLIKQLKAMKLDTRYPQTNSVVLYLIGNFLHINDYPDDVYVEDSQIVQGPREVGADLVYTYTRTYRNEELDLTYQTVDELRYKKVNDDSKIKHHFLAEFMLIY